MAHRSTFGLAASLRSFFISGLRLGIGMGDQWAWFTQAEPQLPKEPLALANLQRQVKLLHQECGERLAVPDSAVCHTGLDRRLSQSLLNQLHLRVVQPTRATGSLAFCQSGKTTLIKAPNPVFHRSGRIPKQPGDFRTGRSLGHQQDAMQSMVVPRFFRAANLVLHCQNHVFTIRYG